MASSTSSKFRLTKDRYLIKIKNQLSKDQKNVMRTQIKRALGWAAFTLWPLVFPGIRSFTLGVIFLLLFGLGIPIKAILNVGNGFGKLNKFAEDLLYEGEIHSVVLETRIEEYQTDNHIGFSANLNGMEIGIMTSKSCQENDTIKVLYHKKYPDKVLPVDHIEKAEFNLIFQFDEELAGLIVPATLDEYYSGTS